MTCFPRWVAVVLAMTASLALAEEPQWKEVAKEPIAIKTRDVVGKPVREVWAEGEIAAPVQDIQVTLMEVARFHTFMPYVKDSREISMRYPDNSAYIYTLTEFPVVGKRDYVVRTWLLEGTQPDGSGTFRNRWQAFPEYLPRRADTIRIELNEGSWVVTPVGDGSKSWAVYRFMTDPGGWIPAFAANMGSTRGVIETYAAVEKEAKKRREERLADLSRKAAAAEKKAAVTPPGPSAGSPQAPSAGSGQAQAPAKD